jgi:hypothetical protein
MASHIPEGWSEHMDPTHSKPYYVNAVRAASSWAALR